MLILFSLFCIGVAMIAGLKLIFLYIFPRPGQEIPVSLNVLFAQGVSPALLFFVGWASSFISVQLLRNSLYPLVLQGLGLLVSTGMVLAS